MTLRLTISLILFFAVTSTTSAGDLFSETPNQVRGFYSKGQLRDANSLKDEGKGFVHIFGRRQRYYGSDGLIETLVRVSSEMLDLFPDSERLQIGDLSNQRGGVAGGHASHQNGLDVDIVYFKNDRREQIDFEGKTGFDEDFVINGQLTPNFDIPRNWALMKAFQKTGRLERIFVHEKIKLTLCEYAESMGELESEFETLRKLRHFPNHQNHLHLRLTCPSTSPQCITQDPIPGAGNGCFSSEPLSTQEWLQGDFD